MIWSKATPSTTTSSTGTFSSTSRVPNWCNRSVVACRARQASRSSLGDCAPTRANTCKSTTLEPNFVANADAVTRTSSLCGPRSTATRILSRSFMVVHSHPFLQTVLTGMMRPRPGYSNASYPRFMPQHLSSLSATSRPFPLAKAIADFRPAFQGRDMKRVVCQHLIEPSQCCLE